MKNSWQVGWKDYYEILQVIPGAEPEVIDGAYKKLAAKYHPDNEKTGDVDKFRLIHEAHEILSNAARKKEYDAAYQERLKNSDQCRTLGEISRKEKSPRPARAPASPGNFGGEDTNFAKKKFCSIGSCFGMIDEKGVCSVCGKAYIQESQRKIKEKPEKPIIDKDI